MNQLGVSTLPPFTEHQLELAVAVPPVSPFTEDFAPNGLTRKRKLHVAVGRVPLGRRMAELTQHTQDQPLSWGSLRFQAQPERNVHWGLSVQLDPLTLTQMLRKHVPLTAGGYEAFQTQMPRAPRSLRGSSHSPDCRQNICCWFM